MKFIVYEDVKTYFNSLFDWLIELGDYRIIIIGFVIGLKMVFRRVLIGISDFRVIINEC